MIMGGFRGVAAAAAAVVVLVLVLAGGDSVAEAVTCSPTELSSCAPAIANGSPPSPQCCSKLKEQKPCFCGYIKNPRLRQYVNSPNARKVVSACGVAYPQC